MENLNLDVASEFMYMSAELMYIKSRMLLPKPEEVSEDEEVDPRAELVRRLLEYQKYQAAADDLGGMLRLDRDVFAAPAEALPDPVAGTAMREVSVFALVHAFNAVLKRQKPELRHHVVLEQISVRKRMLLLVDLMIGKASLPFTELLGDQIVDKLQIIVTFLAILEMTRLRLLRLYESDEGVLYLQPRFDEPDMAIDRIAGIEEQFAG